MHGQQNTKKLALFYLLQIIRGTLFCVFLFQHHHTVGLL